MEHSACPRAERPQVMTRSDVEKLMRRRHVNILGNGCLNEYVRSYHMFDTIGAIGGTAACADIGERYVPEFHP
jgi:hypothetical protein